MTKSELEDVNERLQLRVAELEATVARLTRELNECRRSSCGRLEESRTALAGTPPKERGGKLKEIIEKALAAERHRYELQIAWWKRQAESLSESLRNANETIRWLSEERANYVAEWWKR